MLGDTEAAITTLKESDQGNRQSPEMLDAMGEM